MVNYYFTIFVVGGHVFSIGVPNQASLESATKQLQRAMQDAMNGEYKLVEIDSLCLTNTSIVGYRFGEGEPEHVQHARLRAEIDQKALKRLQDEDDEDWRSSL